MTTLVPQTFIQGIANNAETAAKSGSTYVVMIVGALAAAFAAMSPEQQNALVSVFPFLKGQTMIIAAIATYLVTRLKPSSAVSSQTQDLVDEILRLKANPVLVAAGQPPIPGPTTITVPSASVPSVPAAPQADPMQRSFLSTPTPVDIPLPLGTNESQPIHIMLHTSP